MEKQKAISIKDLREVVRHLEDKAEEIGGVAKRNPDAYYAKGRGDGYKEAASYLKGYLEGRN